MQQRDLEILDNGAIVTKIQDLAELICNECPEPTDSERACSIAWLSGVLASRQSFQGIAGRGD